MIAYKRIHNATLIFSRHQSEYTYLKNWIYSYHHDQLQILKIIIYNVRWCFHLHWLKSSHSRRQTASLLVIDTEETHNCLFLKSDTLTVT